MKKILLALISSCIIQPAVAQQAQTAPVQNTLIISDVKKVEQLPRPEYDWSAFLQANLRYPQAALKAAVEGRVLISFIVDRDGSISKIKAVAGTNLPGGLPEEAVRVVSSMPKWIPGYQNGIPVRCFFSLPINFRFSDSKMQPVYYYNKLDIIPAPSVDYQAFLKQNLRYPKYPLTNKSEATISVVVTIDKNGVLTEANVYDHLETTTTKDLSAEALRVIRLIPSWSPGKINGTAVNSYMNIDVPFQLTEIK